MNKKLAIVQSCYIPWKGYFDMIASVDEFILYDDMQYTRRDWRNRNLIKTPHGRQWLTIPVNVTGKYFQRINETQVYDKLWANNHWKSIIANYSKAKHFKHYSHHLEALYAECENENYLSLINFKFIQTICSILNIHTKLSWSTDYPINNDLRKSERLLALCQEAKATHYISGPSAKNYIDETLFHHNKIKLSWFNYEGYQEYSQLWGEFTHEVTILDLLFNTGEEAHRYMRRMML